MVHNGAKKNWCDGSKFHSGLDFVVWSRLNFHNGVKISWQMRICGVMRQIFCGEINVQIQYSAIHPGGRLSTMFSLLPCLNIMCTCNIIAATRSPTNTNANAETAYPFMFVCKLAQLHLACTYGTMAEYLHIYSTPKYLPHHTANSCLSWNLDSITKF